MRGAARSDDGSVPLPDLARDVLLGAGWSRQAPTSGGAARERWESLPALAALADDLRRPRPASARLPALVRELEERASAQHAPTVNGVTLASFHAAKGLEWDTVFLVGCSDGLLPITMADTPEAVEEERRLLYVGVTRARERLVMSYAVARTPGARATRRPSRFLDGTAAVLGEAARSQPKRSRKAGGGGGKAATPVRTTCRTCGRRPRHRARSAPSGGARPARPPWTSGSSRRCASGGSRPRRAADVPAFVVFTDATLTAIAEKVPADVGALARINGVGPAKLERYGTDVLDLLKNFSDTEKA